MCIWLTDVLFFTQLAILGSTLACTCGSDVVLLSLVDPSAPSVPVPCSDDTITAICLTPRCHEVISPGSTLSLYLSPKVSNTPSIRSGCHSVSVFLRTHMQCC
jgi:hypothetical protein